MENKPTIEDVLKKKKEAEKMIFDILRDFQDYCGLPAEGGTIHVEDTGKGMVLVGFTINVKL